jgi:dTDP-4-dehydrorhamnose reductase
MKIFVTGATGILGTAICNELAVGGHTIKGFGSKDIDLVSFNEVVSKVNQYKPDVIIHCAAYTNVEKAEAEVEECYKVNFVATLNVANAAQQVSAKLIYISSTGCYGNHKTVPYTEFDEVKPSTVHHQSKYAAECIVSSVCKDFLIIRTGWLFGGSKQHKKNFVYNRFLEASKTDHITSDPFQVGNPTYVVDVAKQIGVLINKQVVGVFNVVSAGNCTRYEYVKFIIEKFKLPCKVHKADAPFKRAAAVSPNEAAINFNLNTMGLCIMPDWQSSLTGYIDDLKKDV